MEISTLSGSLGKLQTVLLIIDARLWEYNSLRYIWIAVSRFWKLEGKILGFL